MQKNQIDLSVIIVSFGNTKIYTQRCLDSVISAIEKINSEVILIDNVSTDGTQEMIKKDYSKKVIYIRKDEPYSFGKNNNFGFKVAKGRYILFLNSDTEIIDKNIFKEIIEWMDSNQKVGVISPALLNSDRKTIQASGGYFPKLTRVITWMLFIDNIPFFDIFFKSYHPNLNWFKNKHSQDWVTGAFYLVRKEVLDKVGIFDDDYDAYVEETDLSYRIKKQGWDIQYMPKWKIIHHGGISYGNENSIIYELKNIKLFYKKHYPKWQLPILNIIIKLGVLLRIVVFGIINPNLSKIYAKAIKTV